MSGKLVRIKQLATWPLLLLPQALVLLITKLRFPLLYDETVYHLPSILVIRQGLSDSVPLLRLVAAYSAANGPAPYLIFWAWGSVVGFEPERLRIASLLFGMGSVIIFYLLLQRVSASQPIVYAWLFASWPFFFLYSTTLLVHSIHMFFLLAAIFAFYKGIVAIRTNTLWVFLGAVCSALAVLTRQTSFLIVASLMAYLIVRAVALKRRQSLIAAALSLVACIILLVAVGLAWRGLVPPEFQQKHQIAVSQEAIFLFGLSMAVWFAPLVHRAFKTEHAFRIGLAVVMIVGIAYLLQRLQGTGTQLLTTSIGIVPFAFSLISPLGDLPIAILQLILATIGLVVVSKIITEQSCILSISIQREVGSDEGELSGLLLVAALASLPAALFTSRLFEVYLMTTYVLLLALSSRIRLSGSALLLWLACQMVVAVAYYYIMAYVGIS